MVLNVITKETEALNAISDHHYFYLASVSAIQTLTREGKGDMCEGKALVVIQINFNIDRIFYCNLQMILEVKVAGLFANRRLVDVKL
jgi:hypothetical protein